MASNRRRKTSSGRTSNSNRPIEDAAPSSETTLRRWKTLMNFTGISVDPDTSIIYASDAWWKEQELGNINDGDEECEDGSDTDSGDIQQTQVNQTQEEDEVYRVTIDDDTHIRRSQPQSRLNTQPSVRRSGSGNGSRGGHVTGSGSRGGRRRQSFESTIQDTIAGYTEFQRQNLQQLRPDAFDQHNYDEWKKAEEIFLALNVPKGRFYWTCLNTLKELVFWRKYFLDIAGSHDEDKLQLLEAMTGVSRNNGDVPKQLGQCQSFGSPSFRFQQWVTPPNAQQWGTPPNIQQWGTPPNSQQWETPPNAQQWGTQPNSQQWGTPPNAQQWGTPPNTQRWATPPNSQQWGTQPNSQQWGTPPNISQWGTSPNASQWDTPPKASQWELSSNFQQGGPSRPNPTNVQYGFSVGSEEESVRNTQQETNAAKGTSRNDNDDHISHIPRPGGLFNIWGTSININESHQNYSEGED
ncbi:hypothetical protein N665_0087s0012 [Sinapis alba]|nr:hypothetical protein N665_0087s0012 [Sinapis alba]